MNRLLFLPLHLSSMKYNKELQSEIFDLSKVPNGIILLKSTIDKTVTVNKIIKINP